MKKKFSKLCLLLAMMVAPVALAGSAADDDLQAQLQRLNRAVRAQQPTTINPQVSRPTTPTLTPAGAAAQPTAGIAGALAQAEQQSARRAQQPAQTAPTEEQIRKLKVREEAFDEMSKTALPLTPIQVQVLKHMFSKVQRAAAAHPGVPPRPTSSSLMVNLAPGATPPMIRLSAGFVSSLVFLDATGAPWPIAAYSLGDPRSYNIMWDKKGNTLLVQAVSEYKAGNLAVILKTLNTPIMVTLIPGQKSVDYRVDLRLPVLGPNSHAMPSNLPGKSDPHLLSVLNGIAPPGARRLEVEGGDAEIWCYHRKLFVRTRMTILSPGWVSHLVSADGMQAYHMNKAPVILASRHGKSYKLIVKGL